MRKINGKKIMLRIIQLLVIIATIILTLKALDYATALRGYKGYGGEYLIPILGLLIILIIETIYKESEMKNENRKPNKRRNKKA